MSPWVEVYENAERLGGLECIVAREAGVMVGYCLLFVKPHIHYSQTLCGFEDSYFLTARCRKGLAGYRLLKYSVEVLRQRGCVRAFFMTKQFNTIETILIRLGFAKLDTCLAIWL